MYIYGLKLGGRLQNLCCLGRDVPPYKSVISQQTLSTKEIFLDLNFSNFHAF